MALIIRSRVIKPKTKPPCFGCEDRKMNCHSQCTKYIEWKRAYLERKAAIKEYSSKIADCEEYEISQKQKKYESEAKMMATCKNCVHHKACFTMAKRCGYKCKTYERAEECKHFENKLIEQLPCEGKMQIKTIEKREFNISRQEAKEIAADSKTIAKIDGREYYLANMFPGYSDTYNVVFVSYNPVEIELCWEEAKIKEMKDE